MEKLSDCFPEMGKLDYSGFSDLIMTELSKGMTIPKNTIYPERRLRHDSDMADAIAWAMNSLSKGPSWSICIEEEWG